jgi:hypothetical protein
LVITALPGTTGGAANVLVSDSKGAQLTVAVTVSPPTALFSSAPANLTLAIGTSSSTYTVTGGTAPYSATSANPGLVSASIPTGANFLVITALPGTTGGAANVLVSDSKGAQLTIAVTVSPPLGLSVDAPANLTIAAGAPGNSYTISGGTLPYTVVSSNIAVATSTAPATNGKFVIQGVSAGNATVTIKDAAGTTLILSVTVPAPAALFSTAPATLQILNGTTNFYTVYGGAPPYVVNTNGVIARAVLSGASLAISGVVPGIQTVAVSDAKGAVITIDVTVKQGLYTDAPANLSVASGTVSPSYAIYGGIPYSAVNLYRVNSSNPAVASATVTGSELNISGLSLGSTTLVITDSVGATVSVNVTVPAAGALMSTAPSILKLATGTSGTYAISGGTGPYTATSANPAIVSASVSGSTLVVGAVANTLGGNANVVITDSVGTAPLTISVTAAPVQFFTTAPATLAIATGASKVFAVFGGTLPYSVVNTHPNVVAGVIPGLDGTTLTITSKMAGTGSVILSDAKGVTVTIAVIVNAPGPMSLSAPGSVFVSTSTSNTYDIIGGVPPYMTSSSNLGVVKATIVNGNQVKVDAVGLGSATFAVTDSAGTQVSVSVTTGTVTPPVIVPFFVAAPPAVNIGVSTTATYEVGGGTALYSASSSDTRVATVFASFGSITVTGVAVGKVNLLVSDAMGASKTISVTVDTGGATTTPFFVAAPTSLAMGLGTTSNYAVGGGTSPYSAFSSDVRVVTASVTAAGVITVKALAAGSANLLISDAAGASKTIAVTVDTGSPVSPNANYPTLTPVMQTIGGASTNLIDATNYTLVKVTMKDPSGNGIPNQVISVAGDLTKLSFPDGSAALTDGSGVATIKVARANLLATGAGSMTVTYDYKDGMISTYSGGVTPPTVAKVITAFIGYQVTTANITLTCLNIGAGCDTAATIKAYGTQPVSVITNINGLPATSTPVTVNFSASCGQVMPSTASTDNAGKVLVTYSATDATGTTPSTLGCSGKTVQITASTSGATAVNLPLTVTAAPATSMSFVSALPTRIYLANACGVSPNSANPTCATQSILTFQLLNQSGEGIAGQAVKLALKSLTGSTPKAAFDTLGSVVSVTLTTDSSGKVFQPVYSGSVPTNVIVNASLVANPTIQTDSSVLAIASGRPVQSRLSLSLEKLAIEGYNVDLQTDNVTLNLSDRQGNPVPDGTVVNFVTEGGVMIPATCATGTVAGNSTCTVTIRSQGTRPSNGLVTILAYVAGEEDFIDTNGNNTYDCGEPFTDQGIAYRDDTMTSSLINAYAIGQFTVPRAAEASACGVTSVAPTPSTGDGVWGATDVRKQAVIVFATGGALITSGPLNATTPVQDANVATMGLSEVTISISDNNHNSMPTGSKVDLIAIDNSLLSPAIGTTAGTCTLNGTSSFTVTNSLVPLNLPVSLSKCIVGDQLQVQVTSVLGVVTTAVFTVIP